MDFSKVVAEVAGLLEGEKAPFAIVGALGLHAYGLSRLTEDLDFVTSSAVQDPLVSFLESRGYETLHRSAGYSNHLHADLAMGRVDFLYVDEETARRIFSRPGATLRFGHRQVPVPRPEHLAAMKAHAMKNDPTRALQEMSDIRFLLQLDGVDEDEIRGYFENAGLLERFLEIKRTF